MAITKIDDDLVALGKCKAYISDILYHSDDVRNLTMPTLDDDRFDTLHNFFGGKNLEYFNPVTQKIEYVDLPGHCFDVPYIHEAMTNPCALITMDSFITKIENKQMKEIEIDIFALSHRDFIHMDTTEKDTYVQKGYAGNRVDMMVAAIEMALKTAEMPKDFALGRLRFKPENPIFPYESNTGFYGKKISLLCSDFFIRPNKEKNGVLL